MEKVLVSAAALRTVLEALNGQPHQIRELQVIRNLPGEKSAIDILIDEFNEAATLERQES